MRKEPLLTAVPPAPVQSLTEFYAIAFDLAQKAAGQYGALAERVMKIFGPSAASSRFSQHASAIVPAS
jgi:hypothetical protein